MTTEAPSNVYVISLLCFVSLYFVFWIKYLILFPNVYVLFTWTNNDQKYNGEFQDLFTSIFQKCIYIIINFFTFKKYMYAMPHSVIWHLSGEETSVVLLSRVIIEYTFGNRPYQQKKEVICHHVILILSAKPRALKTFLCQGIEHMTHIYWWQ